MTLASAGYRLVKPLLRASDAETAHRVSLKALALLPPGPLAAPSPLIAIDVLGLSFPNPLGLAAGFDKNGEVPAQMLGLGLGFVEVGTVTPRPQAGNPRPRLFRLTEDHAVINRMGFNNDGHDALTERLKRRPRGIIGVNIGANKDSADRIADYETGARRFSPYTDYLTVNISSPNTPGLRGLQSRGELQELLERLNAVRASLPRRPPMLLKIAPDLSDGELEDIASCCEGTVEGVIIGNTTITRPALTSRHGGETGGLSGKPLFDLSTRQLAKFHILTQGRIPLIGVGGISDAETAFAKISAGASLLQLYSALAFEGPGLIPRILGGLEKKLRTLNIPRIGDAVGRGAAALAHQASPGT
jgi:dihydroorotate dehydrogenase